MCSPAQPMPFASIGANRQAERKFAWPWLMAPRKQRSQRRSAERARASEADATATTDAAGERTPRTVQRRRTDAVGTVTTTTTAPAIPVVPVVPATPATPTAPAGIDWGIRISWKALAGIATLLALAGIGVKAVTYTNNLAHSITTLADAVGKLDGTIGTVTSDIVSLKQRMAVYDANEAARQTELADIQQRQQRMEQAIADLRAAVAASGGRK